MPRNKDKNIRAWKPVDSLWLMVVHCRLATVEVVPYDAIERESMDQGVVGSMPTKAIAQSYELQK